MQENERASDIPSWSFEASLAVPVVYDGINELDVYVEDEELVVQELYVELLRSIFPDKRIEKVFPLDGRENVIKGAIELQGKLTRPSLFIVDGDMYSWGVPSPEVPESVFVLPCYCIENVLCTHAGALTICWEEGEGKSRKEMAEAFQYEAWHAENTAALTALYLEYSVAISLKYSKKTVKLSAAPFCSNKSGFVTPSRINSKIKEIRKECIALVGRDCYLAEKKRINHFYRKNINSPSYLISGKHIWLPLLVKRLTAVTKPKTSRESLRLRLIKYANLNFLNGIEGYVIFPEDHEVPMQHPFARF